MHRFGLVGLVLLGGALATLAQPNPYQPSPYPYPGGYPYGGGYRPGAVGGALHGQADVLRASGDLMISQEQARIEREKATQEKLVTKKKSFEQMMWEKAHTATYTETAEFERNLQLQRMMTSPTEKEISNGKTLNSMLPMIKSLSRQGSLGPPVPLDPDQLRQVNVTVGKDGKNVGMLKEPKLTWPFCLQGPKQKKIESQMAPLVSSATMGAMDYKLYKATLATIADLNDELRKKFHKEEIDGSEFLDGQRFMESLTQSVKDLRDPVAQRQLSGTYAAKGRNVQELIDYMFSQGLSFAPANPGSEAAYYVVHDAFVTYTQGIQAATGFQVKFIPPRAEEFK